MIPAGYRTPRDIRERIAQIEQQQEDLRRQIDRLPYHSPERQGRINMLFSLHDEIAELAAIAYTI